MDRRSLLIVFGATLVALVAGCREAPTVPAAELNVWPVSADEHLARRLALWLRNPAARNAVAEAIATSEFREGKVSWRRFVGRLNSLDHDAISIPARGLLDALGDLELYFPVPEHRSRWHGDTNLILTVVRNDDLLPPRWNGFDLAGNPVLLSAAGPPVTPVLVVHAPEGFIPLRRVPQPAQCLEECTGEGGGGGGSQPPAAPGFFMTDWTIDHKYEPWTAGSPEFELVAWHWTGQWATNAYGGQLPILANPFFSCASGDYPSSDPRDWYYNSPPTWHQASEYGSSGIQILSADEVLAFPGMPGIPLMLLTENDDTGCIAGEFPTAWDPYFPENNDDFIGMASASTLTTASALPFYNFEDNVVHARIGFLRR